MQENGASFRDLQDGYVENAVAAAYRAYYRAYKTKDSAIALGALAVPTRARLLELFGLDDPSVTQRGYDSNSTEAKQRSKELVTAFETRFAQRTTAEWERELRAHDIPCEPVQWVEDMLENEQATANGYIVSLHHDAGFDYKTTGPIFKFDRQNSNVRPSPPLGAHTREVLEEAGLSTNEIDALFASGSVGPISD